MNPDQSTTRGCVIPALRYRDAPAAIKWLCTVFGFEEHLVVPGENGIITHAQLTFRSGMIMLGSYRDDDYSQMHRLPGDQDGFVSQAAYVIVPEIDEHYSRVQSAGAEILVEIADQHYGGRLYTCRDLEGHIWNFGSYDPWTTD
jgi:uncharacterized glyoxalase superfamily protein PhnB